ncbi:MAG: glycoside hydrolase family 6 protein [Terracidiphilus sp.]
MSFKLTPSRWRAQARRLSAYVFVLAVVLLTTMLPGASAQVTHATNPFSGAIGYVSPDWSTEVGAAIASEPAGSTLAEQMNTVANTPTAVWMDHINAIYGGTLNSGRLGLQAHINAALAQQAASGTGQPVVVELVIYDLPDRDCAALASNGELSIAGNDTPIGSTTPLTGTGIQEYENDYITPIYNILAPYASNPNIRFVLVIEDDSLPNMITNVGNNGASPIANCVAANGGVTGSPTTTGVYVQGITYALSKFHSLANVYNYLDVGHHGWLGWPDNFNAAVPFFVQVAKLTTDGVNSVDGFITNTANYGATKEPYMTATTAVGSNGGEVYQSTYFQYDPYIDEEDYAAAFDSALIGAGFPSTLGFLIDTSRNGWGDAALRPTGPSTSTDLNTFVDATKIDLRDDMGQWCNQQNAGIGALPVTNPGGFANLSAYVWIKPPGESDGTYNGGGVYPPSTQWKAGENADENCDPNHDNALANGFATDALPNSPPAGNFWISQFDMLVQNAYPAIPPSAKGTSGYFLTTAGSVTVIQAANVVTSVTVGTFGGYNKPVALTVTGLPANVTAVFSPASVTGATGANLTITATGAAVPGTYPLVVTGTSNGTTETAALSLVVGYAKSFLISVTPTTVNLPPGTNPTATITVTFEGGLTGSVSLSATGLPSGVNANFAPSSVNAPGGSIVVNFNAQTSTVPGSYTVQMVGTNGTITNSAPLTLVIPGSGYSLTPTAPSLTVATGQNATDTIKVTDQGSFTGAVTLTNSALPTGVTLSYGTNPATTSSILTFTVGSNAVVGTYPITITGNSGSLAPVTTPISLVITGGGSFTLSAAPAALSIAQGGSATSVITVTDTGGFTGSVTIGSSSSPVGVTGICGPINPITGNGSCTLTVAVPSSTAVGTYTLTVTGTSGTLTSSAVLTVSVTPATGYTLGASLPILTIPQCGSGTDSITVTPIGGFTGTVTLTVNNLPTGVTVGFGANNVLTFNVACTAVPGTYQIIITGTSGTLSKTTTITLIITPKTGFTIAPSPATLSVAQGASGPDTISVADQGTFTGNVTLAVTSTLPSGVSAAFGTNPTTGSSVLTLSVGKSVAVGSYPITITGTSGTLTPATTTINLTVTPAGGFSCHVAYTITSQWQGGFGASLDIENTSSTAISSWTLTWSFANDQTIPAGSLWNGNVSQSGAKVTVTNLSYDGSIPANGSLNSVGFNGTWNGTNAVPTSFAVNGTTCQ